jgi:hypothetical protein
MTNLTRIAFAALVALAACKSSGSSPDSSPPESGPADAPALIDRPVEASPDASADRGASDGNGCGPGVSAEDCQQCGPPSGDACGMASQAAVPCSQSPSEPLSCCAAGLGRFCACQGGTWHVTICDPPLPAPDAATGQ